MGLVGRGRVKPGGSVSPSHLCLPALGLPPPHPFPASPQCPPFPSLPLLAGGPLVYGASHLSWNFQDPTSHTSLAESLPDALALRPHHSTGPQRMLSSFLFDFDILNKKLSKHIGEYLYKNIPIFP